MDEACGHAACRPAIDFVVESMYAASGFQISELISLFQVYSGHSPKIVMCNQITRHSIGPVIWSHFACPSYFLADTKIAILTIDLVLQRHLSNFISTALDKDVVPIVHVTSTCKLQDLLNQCIQRIAVSTLDT